MKSLKESLFDTDIASSNVNLGPDVVCQYIIDALEKKLKLKCIDIDKTALIWSGGWKLVYNSASMDNTHIINLQYNETKYDCGPLSIRLLIRVKEVRGETILKGIGCEVYNGMTYQMGDYIDSAINSAIMRDTRLKDINFKTSFRDITNFVEECFKNFKKEVDDGKYNIVFDHLNKMLTSTGYTRRSHEISAYNFLREKYEKLMK